MDGTDTYAEVARLVKRLLRHYDAVYNWDSSGQMIREAAAALAQQATQLQEARKERDAVHALLRHRLETDWMLVEARRALDEAQAHGDNPPPPPPNSLLRRGLG